MKADKPKTASTPEPKFEAALADLEQIVADMENGELPLDRLIERYEEGMRLVKVCDEKLSEAEQKIEVLTAGKGAKTAKAKAEPVAEEEDEGAEEDGPSLF